MKLILIAGLLTLSACASLTGNPTTDCANATNATNAASIASLAADANAKINPQSSNMQKLAEYAAAALAVAQANQAQICK